MKGLKNKIQKLAKENDIDLIMKPNRKEE